MSHLEHIQSKILTRNDLARWAEDRHQAGDKVVFTNGCFDLLHRGHVDYLSKAADLGDVLIIGVNADVSVKRLKGEHRPLQDEASRAEILAALTFVSAVVIFEEDTPLNLIQTVKPDVLVKGGDYTIETVVGATEVMQAGGRVELIPFLEGYSTTGIEQKILKESKN